MKWRRSKPDNAQLDGWVAGRMLDEALRVFALLIAAVELDTPAVDPDLAEVMRATALDLLDDAAALAPLVSGAPNWPWWPPTTPAKGSGPPDPIRPAGSLAIGAVEALADYSERLGAVAAVLTARRSPHAPLFAQLARYAENRMQLLAS